jgi:hypothetical protein
MNLLRNGAREYGVQTAYIEYLDSLPSADQSVGDLAVQAIYAVADDAQQQIPAEPEDWRLDMVVFFQLCVTHRQGAARTHLRGRHAPAQVQGDAQAREFPLPALNHSLP